MNKNINAENDECKKLIKSKTTLYIDKNECEQPLSRLDSAESSWLGCLSIWFWCWINPLLSLGYKQTLTENNLDGLPKNDQSFLLLNRLLSHNWNLKSPLKIFLNEFWQEYMYIGLFCFPYMIVRIAQPLLVRQIVLSTMDEQVPAVSIYILAVSLSFCVLFQAFLDHQINFRSMRIGIRIRNALSSFIFVRILSIKSTIWHHIDTGQIINLLANTVYRFEEICIRLHFLWETPLESLIIFLCVCWIMQPIPALVGYCILNFSILILIFIGRYFSKYREMTSISNDIRINAYNEFIHGSQIIKMYNWEKSMENRIAEMRQNEFNCLQRAYYLRALNVSQSYIIVPLLALVTFGTAWLLQYPLNSPDCFATLSFFALIRGQIVFLTPLLTERLKDVGVASQRINSFIQLTSKHEQQSIRLTPSIDQKQEKGRILMKNASFSWYENNPFLQSINLTIEPGTLIGIVGPVGSGKSSLLAAILNEMNLVDGEINTYESTCSYASQIPQIFADTLRNNIIFNRIYDQEHYRNVIYAACLDIDISLFGTSGDLIMIGEGGVNLSGGQKARVALARALYTYADIYLIDDPLASVDQRVAKQIYERCFSKSNGLLKNKTRILVTHKKELLYEADQIIYLSNGQIDQEVHLDENLRKDDDDEKKEPTELDKMLDESISTPDATPIIDKETSLSTHISWKVWFHLFTKSPLKICGFCLLIFLLLLPEIFYHFANYWFSLWLTQPYINQQTMPMYGYVYFGSLLAVIFTDIIRTNYYFYIIIYGTNSLHNNMLKGLLYTCIQFFESNPSGRILYRASRDQRVIDELLPTTLLYAVEAFLMSIGSIIVICFVRPYMIFLFILMIPFVLLLYKYYSRSRRQLKRLESITRSPIYEILSSSLNGIIIIRLYNAKNYLIKLFTNNIDRNTCAYINIQGASRWFALRLSLIPFLNTFVITILMVVYRNDIQPSLIGLCLTYAISIPKAFQLAIQQLSDANLLMTSAERIHEYGKLPPEEEKEDSNDHKKYVDIPFEWPTAGKIEFQNYSLRHRTNLDFVLKSINLTIESKEKLGIIGRTGAGKSSLFKGIFRFIDQSNLDGRILIDNIDINHIPLNYLRSHLSIIPQQSILFSGTLRYNLDPFNQYSDEQCWKVLEDVQLKEFIDGQSSGLLMTINELGNNLSVGQCQLICIARAILKQSRILLIDEATANIDQKTDEIIQKIFSNIFQNRTVLTIAHRLTTVAKCNRIIVLDNGMIVNSGTPVEILEQYQ